MRDRKTLSSSCVDILTKQKWCTFSGIMVAPGNFYNDVSKDWCFQMKEYRFFILQ